MLKKLLFAVAGGMLALPAFAADLTDVQKVIALKDGSAVYVFKDGKMGMEDSYGQAIRMNAGVAMEAKDGQRIVMAGDEVARVSGVLRADVRGGR